MTRNCLLLLVIISHLPPLLFCVKITIKPPPVYNVRGQTTEEVVEESMVGMYAMHPQIGKFMEASKEEMVRYVEETYGETGTEGRQPSQTFLHSSIADSMHHTESLYRQEIKLFKLLSSTLEEITSIIKSVRNTSLLVQDNFAHRSEELLNIVQHFPSNKDLDHVGEAIVDIMDVYKLDVADIAAGVLNISDKKTMKSSHRFGAEDCRILADSAGRKGRLNIRIDWLEMELDRKRLEGEEDDIREIVGLIKKEKAHHDHILVHYGKYGPGTNITGSAMKPFSRDKDVVAKAKHQKKTFNLRKKEIFPFYKNFTMHRLLKFETRSDIIHLYREEEINKMCRGMTMTNSKEDHLRKSSLLHHNNPYLRLSPFKLSIASDKPFIGRITSFLSQEETQALKQKGGRCLKPRIYNFQEGKQDLHHFTAKEICYVSHKRHTIVNNLRKRFQLFMNLNFKDQFLEHENFQIVNYGLGGSLKMHQDHSPFHFTRRLSTFMVYLSSVYGGRTVFPVQGITEQAVEGDAILWYTISAEGSEDQRTQHTACPVMYGSKWVVNLGLNFQENWGPGGVKSGRNYEQWKNIKCLKNNRHYKILQN